MKHIPNSLGDYLGNTTKIIGHPDPEEPDYYAKKPQPEPPDWSEAFGDNMSDDFVMTDTERRMNRK